jgi:hypothetical protein
MTLVIAGNPVMFFILKILVMARPQLFVEIIR